ncbi:MAG: hypothetical protein V9G42_06640 [Bacteroidia bacterium]|jgi:hypothetical protein
MKKLSTVILLILVVFALSQCKKSDNDSTPTPVADTDTHIIFWSSVFIPASGITVTCNGETKNISIYYFSGSPACGETGNATFNLKAGTYPYTASQGSQSWSGSITVGINECKKVDLGTTTSTTTSNADLMQGNYSGNGQYLPGQINLGTNSACTTFPYSSYLQIGATTLNINKIADDTITLQYSSSAFPSIFYTNTPITKNGNVISFYGGTYNVSTKYFSFSGGTPNTIYMTTSACLIQLPYVYGYNPLGTLYTYQTIDHLEFSGTKN